MSGDTHVTVSSVIPVLFNLTNKILKENQDDSTLTRNIKKYIIDYMEKKYADNKTKEILNIATFLDPRFKTDFVEGVDLETVHDNIIDQGMEIFSSHGMSNATAGSQTSLNGTQGDQEPPTKKKKLLLFLQKETWSTNGTSTSCNCTPIQQLQAEVEAYKISPKLGIDSDETPLMWWKNHSTVYPLLGKLSRRYLCICATSCTSERQFSTSSNIVTSSRSSLKPTKVNMLVFFAQNL